MLGVGFRPYCADIGHRRNHIARLQGRLEEFEQIIAFALAATTSEPKVGVRQDTKFQAYVSYVLIQHHVSDIRNEEAL
jgi:hypothetical protein